MIIKNRTPKAGSRASLSMICKPANPETGHSLRRRGNQFVYPQTKMPVQCQQCGKTHSSYGNPFTLATLWLHTVKSHGPRRVYANEPIYGLSVRELEVLELLSTGLSNKEIADRLKLSVHTVRQHTKPIFRKLGVNSRVGATVKLFQENTPRQVVMENKARHKPETFKPALPLQNRMIKILI